MFLFVQQLWSNISKQIVKYLSFLAFYQSNKHNPTKPTHPHEKIQVWEICKILCEVFIVAINLQPLPCNITYYNITYIGPDSWKCNYRVQSQARFKTKRWKLEFKAKNISIEIGQAHGLKIALTQILPTWCSIKMPCRCVYVCSLVFALIF